MAGDCRRRDYAAILVNRYLNNDGPCSVRLPGNRRICRFRQTDGFAIKHASRNRGPWRGRLRRRRWWLFGDVYAGRSRHEPRTCSRARGHGGGRIGIAAAYHSSDAPSNGWNVASLGRHLFGNQLSPGNVRDQFFSDVNILLLNRLNLLWLIRLVLLLRHWYRCNQGREFKILSIQRIVHIQDAGHYQGCYDYCVDSDGDYKKRAFSPQVLLVRARLYKVIEHFYPPNSGAKWIKGPGYFLILLRFSKLPLKQSKFRPL